MSYHCSKKEINWNLQFWHYRKVVLDKICNKLSLLVLEPIDRTITKPTCSHITVPTYSFTNVMNSIRQDKELMRKENFIKYLDLFSGQPTTREQNICRDIHNGNL